MPSARPVGAAHVDDLGVVVAVGQPVDVGCAARPRAPAVRRGAAAGEAGQRARPGPGRPGRRRPGAGAAHTPCSRSHAKSARCSSAPPGVSQTTGAPAWRTTSANSSGGSWPAPKLAWRSAPESKASRLSLAWTRSSRPVIAQHLLDRGAQLDAAGPGVAGVEAEADLLGALGAR